MGTLRADRAEPMRFHPRGRSWWARALSLCLVPLATAALAGCVTVSAGMEAFQMTQSARSALDKGDNEKGLEYARKATELEPKYGISWYLLGHSYFRLKKWDEAIEALNKAISLGVSADQLHDSYFTVGWAYEEKKQYEQAIPFLEQAVKLNPSNATYNNSLGAAYAWSKRPAEAVNLYRKAISLSKDRAHLGVFWDNLGHASLDVGQPDQAIQAFKQSREFGFTQHSGDLEFAERTKSQYAAKIKLLLEQGQRLEDSGRLREALKHYASALLDAARLSGGDQELRERILKLARRLDPPPALPEEAHRHQVMAANIFKEAKGSDDFKRALAQYREAARLAPWAPEVYYNLGTVSEKLGDYPGAIRFLKLYLIGAPDAPDARAVQDQIYVLEGKGAR